MVPRKGGSSQGWFLGWGDPGGGDPAQDPPFLGHKEGGGGGHPALEAPGRDTNK